MNSQNAKIIMFIYVFTQIVGAYLVNTILFKIVRFNEYRIYEIKNNPNGMKILYFSYASQLVLVFFLNKINPTYNSIALNNSLVISCTYLSQLLPYIVGVFFIEKENLKSLGITTNNIKKSLYFGIIFGIIFNLIIIILHIKVVNRQLGMRIITLLKHKLQYKVVLFQLINVTLNALIEEIIFRGYLQIRLINALKFKKGIIITNILFTIVHIPALVYKYNHSSFLEELVRIVAIFCIGLILSHQAHKSKNIIAPIISHALINFL